MFITYTKRSTEFPTVIIEFTVHFGPMDEGHFKLNMCGWSFTAKHITKNTQAILEFGTNYIQTLDTLPR